MKTFKRLLVSVLALGLLLPATLIQEVSAQSISNIGGREVEKALDELDDLSKDLSDLEDDISNMNSTVYYNSLSNGLMDILEDVEREVRRLPNGLTSADKQDIEDAIDDLEDDANDFIDKLKDKSNSIPLTPTPDYKSLYDDTDDLFNDVYDDLDDIQLSSNYNNVTPNQTISTTYVQDILDELDDIQEDIEDDIEDYVKDLASSNSINETILNELKNDILDEVENTNDEISNIKIQLTPVNIADIEDAVEDIEDIINDVLDAIKDRLVSGDTVLNSYNDLEQDCEDDFDDIYNDIDDLKYSAYGTPMNTSNSTILMQLLDKFDDLMEDLEDIDDDYETLTTATDFDNFESDTLDVVEDAEDLINNVRTALNKVEYDNVKNALNDLEDETNDILEEKTDNSPSTLSNLISDLEDELDDMFDDLNDDLTALLTRGTTTSYGVNPNIENVLSKIDDYIEDAEDVEAEVKRITISTAEQLNNYGDELRDIISDVDSEISRLYGPLDPNALTDIEDIIDDFTDAVEDAMEQIADNTSTNLQTQYNLVEDEVDEDLDDLDETVNELEFILGSPNLYPTPINRPIAFIDITSQNLFKDYISALAQRGIINGYGDSTFRPNNLVTRAEFLKMAINAAGIQVPQATYYKYSDVYPSHSLINFIHYADSNGLLAPVSANKYAPDAPIRRIDAVSILLKLKNIQLQYSYASRFSDIVMGNDVAIAETAATLGIISGYPDGTFKPNFALTRGESSKIIAETFKFFTAATSMYGNSYAFSNNTYNYDPYNMYNNNNYYNNYSNYNPNPNYNYSGYQY